MTRVSFSTDGLCRLAFPLRRPIRHRDSSAAAICRLVCLPKTGYNSFREDVPRSLFPRLPFFQKEIAASKMQVSAMGVRLR